MFLSCESSEILQCLLGGDGELTAGVFKIVRNISRKKHNLLEKKARTCRDEAERLRCLLQALQSADAVKSKGSAQLSLSL